MNDPSALAGFYSALGRTMPSLCDSVWRELSAPLGAMVREGRMRVGPWEPAVVIARYTLQTWAPRAVRLCDVWCEAIGAPPCLPDAVVQARSPYGPAWARAALDAMSGLHGPVVEHAYLVIEAALRAPLEIERTTVTRWAMSPAQVGELCGGAAGHLVHAEVDVAAARMVLPDPVPTAFRRTDWTARIDDARRASAEAALAVVVAEATRLANRLVSPAGMPR